MITKEITSLQHPFVKHLVKLRTDSAYRKRQGLVVIAGCKLVKELGPLKIFLTEIGKAPLSVNAEECYFVTPAILKKVTGLMHPEPVAALIDMPPPADLNKKNFLLAIDQISDPGNLGTLLRTALALGWEGAFLIEGSADPFNDKALRSAKGATFRLPLRTGTWQELEKIIETNKMQTFIANAEGTSLNQIRAKAPLLLILGNESHGPSPHAKKQFQNISIPMPGDMESLNVAGAGAILMHHLRGL